jgi:hypothetical protein
MQTFIIGPAEPAACARGGRSPQFRSSSSRQFHVIDVQKSSVSSHCKAPTRGAIEQQKGKVALSHSFAIDCQRRDADGALCHFVKTQPLFFAPKTRSPMKFAFSHNASALILRTK